MPATFVVDASVVVEFLAPGEMAEPSDRFMGALAWPVPIALVAPDLIFLEAPSALNRLAQRRSLSAKAADRAVAQLLQLPIGAVPASNLLEAVWPLRRNVTIHDAAYLALAGGLEVPFVTTDRRLARAARAAGIQAWTADDPELERLLRALETSARG